VQLFLVLLVSHLARETGEVSPRFSLQSLRLGGEFSFPYQD
jgi:hypothetical protein